MDLTLVLVTCPKCLALSVGVANSPSLSSPLSPPEQATSSTISHNRRIAQDHFIHEHSCTSCQSYRKICQKNITIGFKGMPHGTTHDFTMQGFTLLPTWLKSLIRSLKPKRQALRAPLNHDPLPSLDVRRDSLQPPNVRRDRIPITRPSSPVGGSSQSLLLEVLPLEIRQEIWADVLGGHTIHLEIVRDRLYGSHCLSDGRMTCKIGSYSCHTPIEAAKLKNSPRVLPNEEGKLLNLLRTCRQIYTEAINILYSSNTLVISQVRTMEHLHWFLVPQRINAIRTLRFNWLVSYNPPVRFPELSGSWNDRLWNVTPLRNPRRWQEIWHILSIMVGLSELYVFLDVESTWNTLSREAAAELLEPIKQVVQPAVFTLLLPFPAMHEGMPPPTYDVQWTWAARNGWEGSDPWDDLPNCVIRRMGTWELV